MCIILPIDHIPCSHTVAIWQHCIHAIQSLSGLSPCSKIRQHPRPVLTRKLCIHCGGPRYFARRGGVAERGHGGNVKSNNTESVRKQVQSFDSGYCSDVIHEEEEGHDTDSTTSPSKQWQIPEYRYRESSKTARSSQGLVRRGSWKPNLKRELMRHESIDSMISGSQKSDTAERHASPSLQSLSQERKNSTLLHPSSPTEYCVDGPELTMGELTPPATPTRPQPSRQESTLLHPSAPEDEETPDSIDISMKKPIVSIPPKPLPPRSESPREPSTLLHPSAPIDLIYSTPKVPLLSLSHKTDTMNSYPFPVFTETPPTLHSALPDDEWEEPLHSSLSDGESESEFEDDLALGYGIAIAKRPSLGYRKRGLNIMI